MFRYKKERQDTLSLWWQEIREFQLCLEQTFLSSYSATTGSTDYQLCVTMFLSSYSAPTGSTEYQLCVTMLLSSYSAPTGSTEYQLRVTMLLLSYSAPTGNTEYQLCVTMLLSSYSAPTGSTKYQLCQVHRCTEVDNKESCSISTYQPTLRLDRHQQQVRPRAKIPQ